MSEETQKEDLDKIYEIVKSHIHDNFKSKDLYACQAYWECLEVLERYNENLRSISV